jgi:hypothetical protein
MKKAFVPLDIFLWLLFAVAILAALTSISLALFYSPKYGLLFVPFAAWFVLGLSGLIVALDGVAIYFWRRSRLARRDLLDLQGRPLKDEIPAVYGHQNLQQAEWLALIQTLFRHPPAARYIEVKGLPGGHGGSTVVLAEPRADRGGGLVSGSFVVKLGDRREMADEHDKFRNCVLGRLSHAARFFRYAEWESFAGIAYEFVGLDRGSEVKSFFQFYQGYTAVEVAELIGEIYAHLAGAWYDAGRVERTNLYSEYRLLSQKKDRIVERVEGMIDEDDPCRVNLAAAEGRLRPRLKPGFCPDLDIRWYDPVAFLRHWPQKNLAVPVHRSIVHGDLHGGNVLIEIGPGGQRRIWFIDFSHTGNGLSGDRTRRSLQEGIPVDVDTGHTLRDFSRLEADVKFMLTRLPAEDDLRLAVLFEGELLAHGLALPDPSHAQPPIEPLLDERFRKAWHIVGEIRRRAALYLPNPDDLRPYYLSLLHASLPFVYYHPAQFENEMCERQQKRYALIAAGMLCSQL